MVTPHRPQQRTRSCSIGRVAQIIAVLAGFSFLTVITFTDDYRYDEDPRSSILTISSNLSGSSISAKQSSPHVQVIRSSSTIKLHNVSTTPRLLSRSPPHEPPSVAVTAHIAQNQSPSLQGTNRPETGAFQNCTYDIAQEDRPFRSGFHDHTVVVSCRILHYKLPDCLKSASINHPVKHEKDGRRLKLVVGVVSHHSGRRQAVRETWAKNVKDIYFVVAGDFRAVEEEFFREKDILWVDTEERYESLWFKTGAMFAIFYRHIQNFDFVLKTDDDSYINLPELQDELTEGGEGYLSEYFGRCHVKRVMPYRPAQEKRLPPYFRKFIVDKVTYPEKWYPPYCQGAGYLVGPRFLECIGREVAHIRFHPFEDVAVGIIAERCDIQAKGHSDANRYKWHFFVGPVSLRGKILQHPVETAEDLRTRHATVAMK